MVTTLHAHGFLPKEKLLLSGLKQGKFYYVDENVFIMPIKPMIVILNKSVLCTLAMEESRNMEMHQKNVELS